MEFNFLVIKVTEPLKSLYKPTILSFAFEIPFTFLVKLFSLNFGLKSKGEINLSTFLRHSNCEKNLNL